MASNKAVISTYNKIAKVYANTFSNPSEHMDEFLKLLPENGKVLDAGCGMGADSNYAHSKGFKVIGIDMSEKMLEIARGNNSNVDFRLADIKNIKFAENERGGGVLFQKGGI